MAFAMGALLGALSSVAFADGEPVRVGTIVGLLEGPDHAPLAHATVTAVKADGSTVRATISGSDGLYSFADLPAGDWNLSVASAEGEVALPQVSVSAAKATRLDFALNAAAKSQTLVQTTPAPAPPPATPTSHALAQVISKALEAPEAREGVDNFTPFAFGDFTWLNGSPRNKEPAFDTKFFTPDIRLDVHYMQDFNGPKDHTIVGSTESFRTGEFQLEQISFGGDFHWDNVRARILTMYGLFSTTTPRNDASS